MDACKCVKYNATRKSVLIPNKKKTLQDTHRCIFAGSRRLCECTYLGLQRQKDWSHDMVALGSVNGQ